MPSLFNSIQMKIEQYQIDQHNDSLFSRHNNQFIFLQEQLGEQGINAKDIVKLLEAFQVAIPSWALGTGGTRFGRFSGVGEPRSLEEKIEDVGLLHALNRSSGSISLHIPWDIPGQAQPIIDLAASLDLKFDAVNSNTFQDQKDQALSYKFGSLSHVDAKVRNTSCWRASAAVAFHNDVFTRAISANMQRFHDFFLSFFRKIDESPIIYLAE